MKPKPSDTVATERTAETAAVRSSDVVLLLDHCDAAMTAASSQLWDANRDLALELNRRAARCRVMAADLQQNNEISEVAGRKE